MSGKLKLLGLAPCGYTVGWLTVAHLASQGSLGRAQSSKQLTYPQLTCAFCKFPQSGRCVFLQVTSLFGTTFSTHTTKRSNNLIHMHKKSC